MTTVELVARWADKARLATVRRDAAICEMRDAGATLRAIAEAAGMTHAGVARVLKRKPCRELLRLNVTESS